MPQGANHEQKAYHQTFEERDYLALLFADLAAVACGYAYPTHQIDAQR